MKSIIISYPIFGINLNYKGEVPEAWEELTPEQLIMVGKNYLGEVDDNVMLSAMSGIPRYIVRRLDEYHKFSLAESLQFMTDYKPLSHFIILKAGKLHAPAARLEGMSFGQFMFVDTYYSNYLESGSDEDLNKFIGSLYLPKKTEFSTKNIKIQALYASEVPMLVKHAISINYRLLKEFLTNAYPMVFQKPKAGAAAKRSDGWVKIYEAIVGDDIVNEDKYAHLGVHTIMRFLTNQIVKNAKAG